MDNIVEKKYAVVGICDKNHFEVTFLKSSTLGEAKKEAKSFLEGTAEENYYDGVLHFSVPYFKNAYLVLIKEDLPLDIWSNEIKEMHKQRKLLSDKMKRKELYETLKKEFEPNKK